MLHDLRYAIRTLLGAPSFAAAAVVTLAIGIAVNTIAFTLLDSLALRPMPVRDASRIVRVFPVDAEGRRQNLFSYPDYLDYRAGAPGFDGLIAYIPVVLAARTPHGDPQDVIGYVVSPNYFPVLGIETSLGRAFLPREEEQSADSAVAIISHSLWRRRFGSDPAAIGSPLVLNERTFTVIGVGPERFSGTEPLAPDVWVPISMQATVAPGRDLLTDRDASWLLIAGRLRAGVSRRAAAAPLDAMARRLAIDYPSRSRPASIAIAPGTFFTIDPGLRPIIALVFCIVGLVLAITCANVANLVLARTAAKQRELAVRLAIGATRWHLVRQLVAESVVLASAGGCAGLLLSVWTLRFLYPIGLSLLPFEWGAVVLDLSPDVRVFAYTAAIALAAGILLGLAPALQASAPHIVGALHDDGTTIGGRVRRSRLRQALVVAQMAVCLSLLVGAGLFARGLQRARALDLGFDTAGVVFTSYDLNRHRYAAAHAAEFNQSLVETASHLDGVTAVALTSHVPLSGGVVRGTVGLEGRDVRVWCTRTTVSPEYFEALKIPIVRGRGFTAAESQGEAPVAVISEGLAAAFWPGVEPVGRKLNAEGFAVPLTIVGVVRDTSNASLWRDKEMSLYLPLAPASDQRNVHVLVRTSGDPRAVATALRGRARALDPAVKFDATPLDTLLQLWILPSRIAAVAAAVLGGLALLLAAVGIYGVLAYTVACRTREIGIRIALGAGAADVRRLVLIDGARLIAVGTAFGFAGALLIGRLLRRFVFGVSATDPLTFAAVPVFLCAVALAACYIPARRASRIAPLAALKER